MFYPGQKVVCIKDDWIMRLPLWLRLRHWAAGGDSDPVKNRVYTIRTAQYEANRCWLRFEELRNPVVDGAGEPRYCSSHFRPVVERKTDISIFTAMLTGAPSRIDA